MSLKCRVLGIIAIAFLIFVNINVVFASENDFLCDGNDGPYRMCNVNSVLVNDDYNSLITNGVYKSVNTINRHFYRNCPTAFNHSLFVFQTNSWLGDSYTVQLIINDAPVNSAYFRLFNGVNWSDWSYISERIDYTIGINYIQNYINSNIYEVDYGLAAGSWNIWGGRKRSVGWSADLIPCSKGMKIQVLLPDGWYYSLLQGDSPIMLNTDLENTNLRQIETTGKYAAITFFHFVNGAAQYASYEEVKANCRIFIDQVSPSEYFHVLPKSEGAGNIVKRAYQISKINYVTSSYLPTQAQEKSRFYDYIPAGTSVSGVVYSSARSEGLYVPQCVSFESYISAIANPYSYIYTRTQTCNNAKTYYGIVCSSVVAYAYGIEDVIPTTLSFESYEGFRRLDDSEQNVNSLKIADSLNRSHSHIVIITDIAKDRYGNIVWIEIAEGTKVAARTRKFDPVTFTEKYINDGYIAYRYDLADLVTFDDSEWVDLEDGNPTGKINYSIMPRRGNKANWRINETIEIDIFNNDIYTDYVLVDMDRYTINRFGIDDEYLISLSNLPYGHYKLYLTNGHDVSDEVFFNVIDADVSYTPIGDNKVIVYYSSSMGIPSSINWCSSVPESNDYMAVADFHVLTEDEKKVGFAVVEMPQLEADLVDRFCGNGVWFLKVMFKTDYGLYSSDFIGVNIPS